MIQPSSRSTIFSKARLLLAFVPFILLVILHIFILLIILPHENGILNVHIASRAGGQDYFVNGSEFTMINYIAIGVAFIVGVLTYILHRARKLVLSAICFVVLCVFSSVYIGIFLQNSLEVLLDGWGSALGLILSLAIFTTLLSIVLSSNDFNLKNQKIK